MKHYIVGLFTDSQQAGEAVSQLNAAGYTSDISVLAKDWDHQRAKTHTVKIGAAATRAGAISGAVVGGMAGLIGALSSAIVPGVGDFVLTGSVLLTWLLAGTVTGALAGSILGAFIDTGIPDEAVRQYEEAVHRGEVLVLVRISHRDELKVVEILNTYGAVETDIKHQDLAIA